MSAPSKIEKTLERTAIKLEKIDNDEDSNSLRFKKILKSPRNGKSSLNLNVKFQSP